MLRDPIELYEYPYEWYDGKRDVVEKVESGLYILTEDGFLKRGITTATTVCAAINAAIASRYADVDAVEVFTPVGIAVRVTVEAENGVARVKKFSGDHEFDVTDGMVVEAKLSDGRDIRFGDGIGELNGKKAISKDAMRQILRNFSFYRRKYGYEGGVVVEIPEGRKIAEKTANERVGVKRGVSILGTTGFVEPWCKKLVDVKVKIAERYEKIAITTGRKAWFYALKNYPEYQPFVFGVHIDEALRHPGEKIIVGFPGLLSIWAGGRDKIEEKVSKADAKVVVLKAR